MLISKASSFPFLSHEILHQLLVTILTSVSFHLVTIFTFKLLPQIYIFLLLTDKVTSQRKS